MLPDSSQDNSWEPCPAGELPALVHRLRSRRRRQQAFRMASATVVVATVVFVLIASRWFRPEQRPPDEFRFGGVACGEVQRELPRYVQGELPNDLAERFRVHLAECPECGPMYRMMIGEQMSHLVPSRGARSIAQAQVGLRQKFLGRHTPRATASQHAALRPPQAAQLDVAYTLPGARVDWRHVAWGGSIIE